MTETDDNAKVSRRDVFGLGSAALAAATLAVAGEGSANAQRPASHTAPNETDPGPQNLPLAAENPDSEWSPSTDILTCVPEPGGEAMEAAVARARGRHARLLKSAGQAMFGDSQVAMRDLVNRGEG